jgi:sugar/nucleoside kinase (ribokinase family)
VNELHITDGPGRTEIHGTEGRFELIPPPVREVNPIGCGDCYVAGLAHGQLSGWNLAQRYRYAAACGAANAKRWDVAQIAPGADIDCLVNSATVRPLPSDAGEPV